MNEVTQISKIIQNLADGIIIVDSNGKIKFANPAAEKIFGRSKKELMGIPFGYAVVAGERTEVNIPHKDGELRTVELGTTRIKWNGEDADLVAMTDITKRKLAEIREKEGHEFQTRLRSINRTIVESGSEEELFPHVCKILSGMNHVKLACIADRDENENGLRLTYCEGESKDLHAELKKISEGEKPALKPFLQVYKKNKEYVINSADNFLSQSEWGRKLLGKDLRSSVYYPIESDSCPRIVLALFASQNDFFTSEKMNFIGRAVTDISQGRELIALREKLVKSYNKTRMALNGTVEAISRISEKRDPYTQGHEARVAELSCAIGKELGFDSDRIEGINIMGLLHDLGKISIPMELLIKPGKLTELEFAVFKAHPETGYDTLKEIEFPWPVAEAVLQHHERMDGSGYPKGLKGPDIIEEARILAVADVVEAMSSDRPYRPAFGIDTALDEIRKNKGILYDEKIVDTCLDLFNKNKFTFSSKTGRKKQ